MLRDPMLVDEVNKLIAEDRINAEWAVRRVTRKIKHLFDNIPDEYFRERRADVDFVADRVVRNLMGQVVDVEEEVPDGAVVIAHDLSPADAAMLARTRAGRGLRHRPGRPDQPHRHRGARARSTPAVVGAGRASEQISPGRHRRAGRRPRPGAGEPPARTSSRFPGDACAAHQTASRWRCRPRELPAVTTDGFRVRLNGNMEFLEEIPALLAARRRGHRAVPHRVPLPRPADAAHRGGALPRLPAGAGGDGRTAGHHPHAGPGRRQDARVQRSTSASRTRRWGCGPSATASGSRELFRAQLRALLRASVHGNLPRHVPAHLRGVRAARGAERARGLPQRAGPRGRADGRALPGGHHGRDAQRGVDRRPAGAGGGLLLASGPTTSSSTRWPSTGRTATSPTSTSRCTSSVLRSLQGIVDAAAKAAGIPVSMCGEMAGDPRLRAGAAGARARRAVDDRRADPGDEGADPPLLAGERGAS